MSWFVLVDLPWEGYFIGRFEKEDKALAYYDEQAAMIDGHIQGVGLIKGNLVKSEGTTKELESDS